VNDFALDDAALLAEEQALSRTLPPRLELGGIMSDDVLWTTACDWIARHRKAVLQAAGVVLKTRLFDQEDALQSARLIAFTQCRRVAREGQIENFVPLFFSHFRKACLAEWHKRHCEILGEFDWEALTVDNPFVPDSYHLERGRQSARERTIMRALRQLTVRQREICEALLGLGEGEGRLSQVEVAERLQLDASTISKTVEAACRRIAKTKALPSPPKQAAEPTLDQLKHQLAVSMAETRRLRSALIKHVCRQHELTT
jgi:RNA polymerase sigma factor (sigma-70 family)